MTNAAGAQLGPRGYIVCTVCGKETQELSRETHPDYAKCPRCRPPSHKEDLMPAVPKPSQAEKKPARASRAASVKQQTKKAAPTNGSGHTPPTKGKCGTWLAEIKEKGGATRKELIDGCVGRGLKATMHTAMAAYCRQLGLLKEA